jgi:hypothetical protein
MVMNKPPKGGARGRQAERGGDMATAAPKVQKQVAHSAAQAAKIYLNCVIYLTYKLTKIKKINRIK